MAAAKRKLYVYYRQNICVGCGCTYTVTLQKKRQRYHSVQCAADARRLSAADRFWAKVQKAGPDDCWLWTAGLNHAGYGIFGLHHRTDPTRLAHRVAYELTHGLKPGKWRVCHSCDNPKCVNPKHLWLGTDADNHADMLRKGREARNHGLKGERHHQAKLTADQVMEIRARVDLNAPAVARLFGIGITNVHRIRQRRTWTHI